MNHDAFGFSCYAVRRLNPFFGMLQILETSDSRAITADGVDWEIQILTERPHDTWGAPAPVKQKRQFLRFGIWNRVNGLTRVPANPLLDLTKMFKEADRIVEILVLESSRIPFLLRDRYELWLLDDKDQMPLAQLASTTDPGNRSTIIVKSWICSNVEFPSPHLTRCNKIPAESANPNPNKYYLETVVNQQAGRGIQRWFKRTADDNGEPIPFTPEDDSASKYRQLPAETFPLLLLNTSWDDSLAGSVISDYHAWLSPYLLTLQNLPDDLRRSLERKAVERAIAVDNCWRFYPKIINRKLIDAARVEARLRQTQKGLGKRK